jgi:bifunctional non-homologous end joining protein LigD
VSVVMLRSRIPIAGAGFIEPCLPSLATKPPSGSEWLHEIKHDGYRLMIRRDTAGMRLLTRRGYDWTARFPAIASAASVLRAKSFLIDGEAVCCDDKGIAVFDKLRQRRNEWSVFLVAFDLLELNGRDLRREPIEIRKAGLARLLRNAESGLQLSEHIEHEVAIAFEHACKLGLEGIVSKRRGSRYQSGRSSLWLKSKNPEAPALRRLMER